MEMKDATSSENRLWLKLDNFFLSVLKKIYIYMCLLYSSRKLSLLWWWFF